MPRPLGALGRSKAPQGPCPRGRQGRRGSRGAGARWRPCTTLHQDGAAHHEGEAHPKPRGRGMPPIKGRARRWNEAAPLRKMPRGILAALPPIVTRAWALWALGGALQRRQLRRGRAYRCVCYFAHRRSLGPRRRAVNKPPFMRKVGGRERSTRETHAAVPLLLCGYSQGRASALQGPLR